MKIAARTNVGCATGSVGKGFLLAPIHLEYGASTLSEQWAHIIASSDPGQEPHIAEFLNERVIQITDDAGVTTEYRIKNRKENRETARVQLSAAPILLDLNYSTIMQVLAGVERYVISTGELTPEQFIDNYVIPTLVAKGITWITKGTITPTAKRALTLDHTTALGLLRELVVGTDCDVILRRNGTTDYKIDLVRLNSTATRPIALVGQNVEALTTEEDSGDLVTVAKPTGLTPSGALEKATVAGTVMKVTARSGTSVTVKDPRNNGDMIAGDDMLNAQYLTVPAVYAAGLTLGGGAGFTPVYGAWAAYSALKDRLYVFQATQNYFAHEIHPTTGELLSYIDNSVFSGDATGIHAVCYVPKGASGKIWIWVNGGAKIIELDCAAHTVTTVRASGAVTPQTRPIYHSGQDAIYYVNGTNVHKYLAASPYTASSFAIGNTGYGMAWVSSVSLFYITTNVASPALRTYDPSTDTFASITPTGAATWTSIEYDAGEDRIVVSDDADNGGLRLHLIDPAGTDTITDTLTVTLAAGWANTILDYGTVVGGNLRQWSLAAAGMAWFVVRDNVTVPNRTGLVQVDVAGATVVQLDNAVFPYPGSGYAAGARLLAYDAQRGLIYLSAGGACLGINPSHGCFESKVLINDTLDATDQLVVADREELFEAGVLVGLARDADGTRMTTMRHTGAIALYGEQEAVLDVSAFRGERQLLKDPYFNEWFSTQWPKYVSHQWDQVVSYENGTRQGDLRAKWSEYPTSAVTVHNFLANGTLSVGATTITLDGGPLSTVIPAGARVFDGVNYLWVQRRAVTDGSGAVTLYIRNNGLQNGFADNAAVTVHVPPLGGTAPNGIAEYTHLMSPGQSAIGRWTLTPSSIPNATYPGEWYTTRLRFGGYWGGRPDQLFKILSGVRPAEMETSTSWTSVDDSTDYPFGVRFIEVAVSGRRGPGLHFDGFRLDPNYSGGQLAQPYLWVIDRLGVLVNYEPGAAGGPPFTEYGHANQLWAVGKEALEYKRNPLLSYDLRVIELDDMRPFILGAHVDLRDPVRGRFTREPRISNLRYEEYQEGGAAPRRPIITVDTKVPTVASLAAGPAGEVSAGPEDVPEVPTGGTSTPPGETPTTPPPTTDPAATGLEANWLRGYFVR